jgi:hypothetical protein
MSYTEVDYQSIPNHGTIQWSEAKDKEYDHVVIVGTPWIWDGMVRSDKAKALKEMLDHLRQRSPQAVYELQGGGSCFIDRAHAFLAVETQKKTIKEYFDSLKLDLISVRDRYAKTLLDQATLRPCPALYALSKPEVPGTNYSIVYTDPTHTISGSQWRNRPELTEQYNEFFRKEIKLPNTRVYVTIKAEDKDIAALRAIGYEGKIDVLKTTQDVQTMLNDSAKLLSARVHVAVPSYPYLREQVTLVAIDTRADTFAHLGGKVKSFA